MKYNAKSVFSGRTRVVFDNRILLRAKNVFVSMSEVADAFLCSLC